MQQQALMPSTHNCWKCARESQPNHFNTCGKKFLKIGIIPQALKTEIITAIHKGDSRGQASQYRHVTPTSHIIRVCERIVRGKMVRFFENIIFDIEQHDLGQHWSCLSQLLVHYEGILENLRNGNIAVSFGHLIKFKTWPPLKPLKEPLPSMHMTVTLTMSSSILCICDKWSESLCDSLSPAVPKCLCYLCMWYL